jgi:hypothetical protein
LYGTFKSPSTYVGKMSPPLRTLVAFKAQMEARRAIIKRCGGRFPSEGEVCLSIFFHSFLFRDDR